MTNNYNTPLSSTVTSLEEYRNKNYSTPSALPSKKESLKEEVKLTRDEYKAEIKINPEAVESAMYFIDHLPYDIKEPSISIENSNSFLFEWLQIENKKTIIFSVIVEKNRMIYSTYNFENGDTQGVSNLSSASINIISTIASQHFKIQANDTSERKRNTL